MNNALLSKKISGNNIKMSEIESENESNYSEDDNQPIEKVKPTSRPKKERTPAQIEAFKRCRAKMLESRKKRAQMKQTEKEEVKQQKKALRKKITKLVRNANQQSNPSESESESEPQPIIVKKPSKNGSANR